MVTRARYGLLRRVVPLLGLLCIAGGVSPAALAQHARADWTCPTGNAAILSPTLTAVQGGTATATFSIARYCTHIQFSLASYDAPAFDFALPQVLIDSKTGYFNAGGPYTQTVNVSPCFFQVDLVRGAVITNLTTSTLYGDRKLKWVNGGTKCASKLTTTASAAVDIGNAISDSAVLSGLSAGAGGTITFKAYGPNDTTCSLTPAFTSSAIAVSGSGTYSSGMFTPAAVGTYRWIASYTGDSRNAAIAGTCGDSGESVLIRLKSPGLVTSASANITLGGGSLSDSATLSGATTTAGGTITFRLYGPNDATCSGVAAFSSVIPVSGNGVYGSGTFTPTSAGTYRWTAVYSGDLKNATVTDGCNADNESATVSPRGPTLNTNASADVLLGHPISDTATLAGATATAGGSITFRLYGPNDTTCGAAPAFTSLAIPVSGNGSYGSGTVTPTLAGTYRWTASYSGDLNNLPVSTSCNDAHESVTVGEDRTPASCVLSAIVAGPPKQLKITVQDGESGIQSIAVDAITNATASWPAFAAGITTPITVTATKTDQTKSAFLRLKITNTAGLVTTCDPKIPAGASKVAQRRQARSQAVASGFSLTADARRLTFGSQRGVSFSGRIPGAKAGQAVTVFSQACGFDSASPLMTVKTGKGGVYHFRVQPGLNTSFSVRWNGHSRTILVSVRPSVSLVRESAGRYRVDVSTTNGIFLDGQHVVIQRWRGGRWVSAGGTTLAANSPADEMTAVSSGIYAASLYGVKLRAVVPATACYASATSGTIRG